METGKKSQSVYHFQKVSLLVTHYNRSQSLLRLLNAFKALQCSFAEIIVSDDFSDAVHLKELQAKKEKYGYHLITSDKNLGLGNNINKGQDEVTSIYTLYIQEDFIPMKDFPEMLQEALKAMEENSTLDLVRFYAYIKYPYLKSYTQNFSIMHLPNLGMKYTKLYQYSDHPHLRRSTFLSKFGRYQEGVKGDRTEYKMCVSFIKNKGTCLFYNQYKNLFIQKNSVAEPTTMNREKWKESNLFFIKVLRNVFRQVKNNYHIHFVKN